MTHYLPYVQTAVFVIYITLIWARYGVLDSISASYYELPQKWNWLFTIFLWALGFTILFYGSVWFFFAGAFLCFAGTASQFKESLTSTVHYVGAVGGIVFATIGIHNAFLSIMMIFGVFGLAVLDIKNLTWWTETLCFIMITIGCFLL